MRILHKGINEVILKGDQEPSIQSLVREVQKRRSHPTMLEFPPKASHQGNGVVESEIGRIEGLVKTLVLHVEQKLPVRITSQSLILP